MYLKIYVPCKYFHMPIQYEYNPCKGAVYTAGENMNISPQSLAQSGT